MLQEEQLHYETEANWESNAKKTVQQQKACVESM